MIVTFEHSKRHNTTVENIIESESHKPLTKNTKHREKLERSPLCVFRIRERECVLYKRSPYATNFPNYMRKSFIES